METSEYSLTVEVDQVVDAFYLPEQSEEVVAEHPDPLQQFADEYAAAEVSEAERLNAEAADAAFLEAVAIYGSKAAALYYTAMQEAASNGDFAAMDALTTKYNEGGFG